MKTNLSICLLLALGTVTAQDTLPRNRFALHLEAGWYGFYGYTVPHYRQLLDLAGQASSSTRVLQVHTGSHSTLNAWYYTLNYQVRTRHNPALKFSFGISWYSQSLVHASGHSDSLAISGPYLNHIGESVQANRFYKWTEYYSIYGSVLNLPVGLRYQFKRKGWRLFEPGINAAPGFSFNHRYRHVSSLYYSLVVTDPGETVESYYGSGFNTSNETTETKKLGGSFASFYTSLPFGFCLNPGSRWQCLLVFEPGYAFTRFHSKLSQESFMSRFSLGIRYAPRS